MKVSVGVMCFMDVVGMVWESLPNMAVEVNKAETDCSKARLADNCTLASGRVSE